MMSESPHSTHTGNTVGWVHFMLVVVVEVGIGWYFYGRLFILLFFTKRFFNCRVHYSVVFIVYAAVFTVHYRAFCIVLLDHYYS